MAIGANSYGTVAGVAALTPRYSGSDFAATTRPALSTVESWIDEISAITNMILANVGFETPISQAQPKLMLDIFVNQEVAAMVEGVNGSGRFGPTAKKGIGNRFNIIFDDVKDFIDSIAIGIEREGATRTYDPIAGISFREDDEGGTSTAPIFQRSGFGNSFIDWDN